MVVKVTMFWHQPKCCDLNNQVEDTYLIRWMYNNIKYTLKICNEILSKYPFVQLKVFIHISNYIFLIIELKLLGVFIKPSLLCYHFLKKNFIFFFFVWIIHLTKAKEWIKTSKTQRSSNDPTKLEMLTTLKIIDNI